MHSNHLPTQNMWSSGSSTPVPEETCSRSERRAAALAKFRQRRKERCFDKKVRYVNRKKLAETRPRVRDSEDSLLGRQAIPILSALEMTSLKMKMMIHRPGR